MKLIVLFYFVGTILAIIENKETVKNVILKVLYGKRSQRVLYSYTGLKIILLWPFMLLEKIITEQKG